MKKNNIPLNFREKINSRISLLCSVVALIILVVIIHQLDYTLISKPQKEAVEAAALEEQKAKEAAETPEITTASVIAVGDNLYHSKLYESGEYDSGNWNYDHIYTNVLDEIQAADVAMIDQETVFAPDHDSVSTYPSFATPQEVGDAIIKAGFDVVESATNHADDYGYDYLKTTLDFWSSKYPTIPVLGIHSTQEDADIVKVKEVNGIKIAFLDYTYGTNNSGAGEGYEYMIDIFDKDKITTMIQKAKSICDCLIFVAHWGTEKEAKQHIRKLLHAKLMMMAQAGQIQVSEDIHDFMPSYDRLVKEFSCIKLLDGSKEVRKTLRDIIYDLKRIDDIDMTNDPFENGSVDKTYAILPDSEAYLYFNNVSVETKIACLQELLDDMKNFNDSMEGSENQNEEK